MALQYLPKQTHGAAARSRAARTRFPARPSFTSPSTTTRQQTYAITPARIYFEADRGNFGATGICEAKPSSEEKQKLTTWNDVIYKWSWEEAARAAYLSVGLDPSEINKEIQIIAARLRISLLRQTYFCSGNIGERAATINAIAGTTPQP